MDVQLLPEMEDKLTDLARQTGRGTDELVNEALASFIERQNAYLAAVDEGIAADERGDLVEDHQVLAWLNAQEERARR
jgi:predicted transcriptional regulator